MFCLRSWIPILFFLTNASPIYLILFISATYFLNRPCVYCSLLLAILVVALFDFRTDWFEHAPTTPVDKKDEGIVGYVVSAVTAQAVDRFGGVLGQARSPGSVVGEWVRGLLRKEWRVSCLGVTVHL